ncbi:MAG TPA: gliding motility-associated C-terminal domain-containing protein [Bacteroidales bacterium]|jgi:gliding motility-associated-like protein|nr:gliding motility-associated C-terminal domain-containing protein [Bacteroidales bacterium]
MKFAHIIAFTLLSLSAWATHNRAGEIRYRHISGFTYEITMVTYTYTLSQADRPELEVQWGDGTSSIIPRVSKIELPNDYYNKNTYIGTHTFPGPGIYKITMEDQNRNYGVRNIPNSVEVPFTIQTTLNINPTVGNNSTPVLTYPPIDKAKLNTTFIHNPGAYDPDGDSLAYRLTVCLGESGLPIPNYTFPYASDSLTVNRVTGDLIWERPQQTGIYNVAMIIEEWRWYSTTKNYIKISELERDIQIEVIESSNQPPILPHLPDICVWAGDSISFQVTTTDPQNDKITLNAYGGPFEVSESPAHFDTLVGFGPLTNTFTWSTKCSHIKKFPYLVVFRAKDHNSEVYLASQQKVYIQVVCPPVQTVNVNPTSNSILVSWSHCPCSQADHFDIYRKVNPSGWNPDSCETGIPPTIGFVKIHSTNNINDTAYLDNNNGIGLPQGYTYCYRIVSVFPDFAESIASEEVCTDLVKGIPVITHVSIDSTDFQKGKTYVEWSKPTEFDSIAAHGPYKYLIYRSADFWGQQLTLIDSLNTINDTLYRDSLLNTTQNPYSYKIEFYNDEPGNRFLIGYPSIASSIYLNTQPDDNQVHLTWQKNVPWTNTQYIIYRKNATSQMWDSIGHTSQTIFTDDSLVNGNEYCYKIKGLGYYYSGNYNMPFINFSQEKCETPRDTTPPCAPNLTVHSECTLYQNLLVWTNPNHYCCDDVTGYRIYYSPTLNGNLTLIAEKGNPNDTTYIHNPTYSLAGCYVVTAVDSFLNESSKAHKICVDECTYYNLPNIFTPDANGQNDFFKPGPYRFVEKVDMKIYNRWGKLVFQTDNPDIMWDGKDMDSKKRVTDGVYYYICDVYERRLSGIEPRAITGFIQVMTTKKSGNE